MAENNVLFTMGHILLLLFLSFTFVNMQISDKRLCADKECKAVISTVKALGRHVGDHPLLLTFALGDVISVTSKSAGSNPRLWGGEVKGQRGYFDKNFVQEIKVFVESPEHEVDTEGDIFERLGKPPPATDDKNRKKVINLHSGDDTDVSKKKKEDAQNGESALPAGDNDETRDVEEHKKTSDLEDKKDEEKENILNKDDVVEDLLNMAATLDKASNKNDESVNSESSDDEDDDNANFEEDLEEDFWDIEDNFDDDKDHHNSYKWERDRFDTTELNNFLKKKLLSSSPSEAEAGDNPSEKETESLKVEPEVVEAVRDHRNEEIKNVEKEEVSDESVSSKDVNKSDREDSDKVDEPSNNSKDVSNEAVSNEAVSNEEAGDGKPAEIKVRDHKNEDIKNVKTQEVSDESVSSKDVNKSDKEDGSKGDDPLNNSKDVSNEDDGEGEQVDITDGDKQSSKQETVEDTHVDIEADDPTEIDESSPDEFDMNKMVTGRTESEEVAENNGKKEGKTVEEGISESHVHSESEDDARSDESLQLKSEHLSELDESHDSKGTQGRDRAKGTGEEAVSKDEMGKDAEADIGHDMKNKSKSSEATNVEVDENAKNDEAGDKETSAGDKFRDETNLEKKPTTEREENVSDISHDTPLNKSSLELSHETGSDAVEKSKLESDMERRGHKFETTSVEAEQLSPSLSDEDEGRSEEESSIVGQDDKPTGAGILRSSRTQLEDSDLPKETPKLNINPTSAFISEKISDSHPSQEDIELSKTDDHRVDTTGDNSDTKLFEIEELETIEEGGSTIILNKHGEIVTAILPEGHKSQTSDAVELTLSDDVASASLTNSEQLNPTAVESILKPTQSPEEVSKVDIESLQSDGNDVNHSNKSNSNIQLENSDLLLDSNMANKDYQSADFNSRKVLSVDHTAAAAATQQQPQPLSNSQEQPSGGKKDQNLDSVILTPVVSLPSKLNSEMSSSTSVTLAETPSDILADAENKESSPVQGQSSAGDTGGKMKEEVSPDQQKQPDGTPTVTEATTEVPTGHVDIPPSENAVESAQTPEDYSTDPVYHSRKINDQDLLNEEEQKFTEPSQGFFKKILTALERQTKNLLEKLPPSVHSVLESFGLLPNMKLLVITFALALLISMIVISCCSSGGSNKKLKQAMLVKCDELEKKRLIDIKEKQNMEDEIASKEAKNLHMKEEIEKMKEEAKKNKSELQTVQLHNETLKKQLTALQSQVHELKENASSKQGEVKQQSKKTKDLEKQIKKFEDRERNLEQTAQKLTSDLKHKEEEVVLLTSKLAGFTDLVGHLQTSKDQLLAEADDWKEKVSDLKDRLEQREEEFKHMQETIMFKENELEVLKDCFLQLKSFEESEEGEEDAENVNARVQEKIASMMDVSKMNASLIALEEERNSLANKLKIELEARRELEEQLESSRRSLETSMTDKMKAERQYQEAQTKFNVLSSYFKEKEMQLQRELGEHEALKKQNQNKLVSADETTKSVQQELDFIRTQNESLKRELASSERDFRSQIAANEKKAHENWLAARAAERELKEARHEAGVLRQKLTDIERRQFMGPGGLIRPLPTRIPPAGILNGPPPPGMDRSPSRGSMPPIPPPHMRDDDFLAASRGDRGPPLFPLDMRRGPLPPPGMRPPLDARSPPPRLPPFGSAHSPPPRMPPPGMMDGRSPPPYDRRPPPHHMPDRRSPPFRLPPPDMLPPPLRGGPLPPHYLGRGGAGSPTMGLDSPHLDGRYPLPPYGRNPPHPSDRPSPKQSKQMSPQQSQV